MTSISEAPSPWIRGPGFDLTFISGSVLAQYAFLLLVVFGGVPTMLAFYVYSALLDSPHSVATHLRVFESAESRGRHLRVWRLSFLLFLVGPAAMALVWWSGSRLPFQVFYLSVLLWAAFHAVRQHYGFYALYQQKRGGPAGAQSPWTYWLFHGAFLLSAFYYIFAGPFPAWVFGTPVVAQGALDAVAAAMLVGMTALLAIETDELRRNGTRGWPKFLFVAGLTSFPLFLHFSGMIRAIDVYCVMPLVTIQHNVQYLAFVRAHQDNVSRKSEGDGLRMPRNLLQFGLVVLGIGLMVRGIEWSTTSVGEFFPKVGPNFIIVPGVSFYDFMLATLLGYSLQHYFLDQFLWRLRRDETYGKHFKS